MSAEMKVHIKCPKCFQVTALRVQSILAVSGITCSIDPDKAFGKSWLRFYITKEGVVDLRESSFLPIVPHVWRLIEALLALSEYGKGIDAKS